MVPRNLIVQLCFCESRSTKWILISPDYSERMIRITCIVFSLLGLLAGSLTVQAQSQPAAESASAAYKKESSFYAKVYGSYGLLTPGSELNSGTSQSSTFRTNRKGLGAGWRAGVGIGFIVNDFLNIGLDADLFLGDKLTTRSSSQTNRYVFSATDEATLRVVSLTPNLTFKALSRPTYFIYNRVGVVVGKVLAYQTSYRYTDQPAPDQIKPGDSMNSGDSKSDFTKNGLAIGYQAALGVQFRISQALRGFVEIVAINQSFQPQRQEVTYTTSTTNAGTETTAYIEKYERQGESTSTTEDGKTVYHYPLYNVAMNSVGVGAGLIFRF